MKKRQLSPIALLAVFTAAFVLFSCRKHTTPPPPRMVQYILYTKKDFSHVFDTIRFQIYMTAGTHHLLDSNLAPMTVAAIPDSAHALVITKTVPHEYEQSALAVGFLYAIDNVGQSWYLDSSAAGETFKKVVYSFE